LPLRYEVIATGPERGYEEIPDEVVKEGFLKGLRDAGFRISDDPSDMHVVLRRNRESFHRYLLTRPGELSLRPVHQSPLENLCLAGAWVRNDFALPCVDAAAEGAIKVAELIAARAVAARSSDAVRPIPSMPRGAPLVLPPPYHFPCSTASLFLLNVNPERLTEAISADLKLFPGFSTKILFAVLRHENVHAQFDPSGSRYAYNEVMLAAFVREKRFNPIGRMGLYPICLYVDDDTAMAAGREIYGFPKKMARIELGGQQLSVVRGGLVPGAAPGPVQPISLMSAHWSAKLPTKLSRAAKSASSLPSLGDMARLMAFYNTRHMTHLGVRSESSDVSQLTKVALTDVQMGRVSSIHDLRLRLAASVNDPVYRLLQVESDAAEISAAWGVSVELAFSMGTAVTVEADRRIRENEDLNQLPRVRREAG
jgi:Acetoacetate decarboxylase (ADC)